MSVVVKKSTLLADAPDTAAEFLKRYPSSPYTAFLVTANNHVSCFDQHCDRLAAGFTALAAARSNGDPQGPHVGA